MSGIEVSNTNQAPAELARARRALKILTESQRSLLRAKEESALLHGLCELATELGGYGLAWAGLVDAAEPRAARPMACTGSGAREIVLNEEAPTGPTATALATGAPCVVRDILDDPAFSRRRDAIARSGYRTALALPLLAGEQTLGVFEIYSTERDAFDADEQAFFAQLADQAAHSALALRSQRERTRTEATLRIAERRLTLMDSFPGFLSRFDAEGRFVYVSPSIHRTTGVPPDLVLGKTPLEFPGCSAEHCRRMHESVHRVLSEGQPDELEVAFPTPTGEEPYEVRHIPERDEHGAVVGVLGISMNVGERKRAERQREAAEVALRESEALYRTLVNAMAEGVILQDASGVVTAMNPAVERILGHPAAAFVGKALHERPDTQPVCEDGTPFPREKSPSRQALRTGEPQTNVVIGLRRRDNTRAWISSNAQPLFRPGDARPYAVVTTFHDITALKETERQLRNLTENSPDLVLRFDGSGRCLYANSAVARLCGVVAPQPGEPPGTRTKQGIDELYRALKESIAEVYASHASLEIEQAVSFPTGEYVFNLRLIPEFADTQTVSSVLTVGRNISEQKRAEEASLATELRLRQVTEAIDEVFWVTNAEKTECIYVSPAYERVFGKPCSTLYSNPHSWLELVHAEDRERVQEATRHLAEGGYDLEYRIVHREGTRWVHERTAPLRNDSGQVYCVAGVVEDVTLRRQLEEQLRQAQKMEAVGQLAGGIAHDFNNVLAIIQLQCSLLLHAPNELRATREGLNEILAATERATHLTRQLLTFSRHQHSQPSDLDIGSTIGVMTKLLRRLLGEDVALETQFAPALPLVRADPGMMEQVLMNLAINARDAMPGGGRLTVALEAVHVSKQHASLHSGAAPGRHVCLSVSDTGCGVKAQDLPRIFEPFFTTKELGKGTGLGLATVFGIVQEHHGWIEVESTLGQGTTFKVFLPAGEQSASTPPRPAQDSLVRGGNETVLLVEDEHAVRTLVRSALERYGYSVLEADSARAALEQWERATQKVDLLLTDLIMPGGMSGWQLAVELLERDPGLKVIYISGYSPEVVHGQLRLSRGVVVQKPFATAELAAHVRRCLDGGVAEVRAPAQERPLPNGASPRR